MSILTSITNRYILSVLLELESHSLQFHFSKSIQLRAHKKLLRLVKNVGFLLCSCVHHVLQSIDVIDLKRPFTFYRHGQSKHSIFPLLLQEGIEREDTN